MRYAITVGLALLSLAVLLSGCGPAAGASAAPVATTTVEMPPSYRFSPPVITVRVGTTVTWHNADHFTHSVFLLDGSGINKIAKPGESVSITFDHAGTFKYRCAYHPNDMQGSVIVTN